MTQTRHTDIRSGGGDMYKTDYDPDDDLVADAAETVKADYIAGQALQSGDAVYTSEQYPGKVITCLASNPSRMPCIGFAAHGASLGQPVKVTLSGPLTPRFTGVLDVNKCVFVSETDPGFVSSIPPSEKGSLIQPVGIAKTGSVIIARIGREVLIG